MGASSCEVQWAAHVAPSHYAVCPKDRVCGLTPAWLVTQSHFEQGLSYVEVRSLDKTVCLRIVSWNMDMINVVLFQQLFTSFDKCRPIVGDDLRECSPPTKDVLVDPFTQCVCHLCMNSGQWERVQQPYTMYLKPPEVGRCMVSICIFANRGTGRGTVGSMRICWVCRSWQRRQVFTNQVMSDSILGHKKHSAMWVLIAKYPLWVTSLWVAQRMFMCVSGKVTNLWWLLLFHLMPTILGQTPLFLYEPSMSSWHHYDIIPTMTSPSHHYDFITPLWPHLPTYDIIPRTL